MPDDFGRRFTCMLAISLREFKKTANRVVAQIGVGWALLPGHRRPGVAIVRAHRTTTANRGGSLYSPERLKEWAIWRVSIGGSEFAGHTRFACSINDIGCIDLAVRAFSHTLFS